MAPSHQGIRCGNTLQTYIPSDSHYSMLTGHEERQYAREAQGHCTTDDGIAYLVL